MSYDPFGDDPDADIFRDDDDKDITTEEIQTTEEDIERKGSYKHTIDGSTCPSCNVPHGDGSVYNELPSEAIEILLGMLDGIPPEMVKEIFDGEYRVENRKEADLLTTFVKYTEVKHSKNKDGPLIQAMMEFLDEQSNGMVSAKWKVYEAERKLVMAHTILKNVNDSLEEARSIEDADPILLSLLDLAIDIAHERVQGFKEEYLEAAYKIGYDVQEDILEHGFYPEDYRTEHPELAKEFLLKLK